MKNLLCVLALLILCSYPSRNAFGQAENPSVNQNESKGASATKQEKKEASAYGESFSVYVDNDSSYVGGPAQDQGYSSGIRFSYVYAENNAPSWAQGLPEFKNATSNYGFSIAQEIYTPDDTSRVELISNDRPYAGYLYFGFTAAYKTEKRHHLFGLDLGIIGPEAMGESLQNGFHDAIQYDHHAKGWSHQLGTEPTAQFSYTQKMRFYEQSSKSLGRYFDVIPQAGTRIGNVRVDAHLGAIVRFGIRLPDDFGPSGMNAVGGDNLDLQLFHRDIPWRLYGFAGARGRAVVRNIFLDGNTFRDSHSVRKYPIIAETEFGYALQVSNWSFSWRFVSLTPEFEENSEFDSYASLALSYMREF